MALLRTLYFAILVLRNIFVSGFVTSGRGTNNKSTQSSIQTTRREPTRQPPNQRAWRIPERRRWTQKLSPLFMANPDFSSNNPYQVLGITDATPTKADIKRVYRKLAMTYHPDVAPAADKQIASERFAKINSAYRDILERLECGETSPRQTTTASSSSAGSGAWEPPHRRSGPYRPNSSSSTKSSNSNPYASTDWRDYMPKTNDNDDEKYDTKGDSFEKILSDLFSQGASGSVSFMSDFLDFFESNFDAYTSKGGSSSKIPDNNDSELQAILRSGSVLEVRAEMEETELVVRQLTTKLGAIRQELDPLQQTQSQTTLRYSERMQNQERIDELAAQRTVVEGYVKTAQRRLLALQNRYKELKQQGSSSSSGATQSTSWNDVRTAAASGSSSGTTSTNNNNSQSSSNPNSSSADTSWKSEGFGTYGRRGSGNRRSRTTAETTVSSSSSRSSSSYDFQQSTSPSERRRPPPPPSSSTQNNATFVPPHRRPPSIPLSSYRDKVENERRLREIKVDEEFDKLKKELGLS